MNRGSTSGTAEQRHSGTSTSTHADTKTTGSTAAPTLTTQQQTEIRQSITKVDVKPVTNVSFSVSTGTVIPTDVRLHELPATIVKIVPAYRGYRFIVVGNDIVIIQPRTRRIVEVIHNAA
jgi:uncharacterized protein DUF1236